MSNILKYQNPSSPLLPAAIKIGYTYKPDISRSTEVEGATPIVDLQELSKKEKSSLYEAYDFYANDVYPRKQKYNGSYNPEIHNMDNLTKRVIFREPLNFKNGFNRGGYAPIYLPSESSQIPNFLTPIVTRKPRDFGNTVLHEATHAEDGDSFKTDNFKLGESMTDEEVKLLDDAYKFEYEDDMTRAEKQTTNREFRFGLSRLTGLYLDDLTDYINNLSTKELKKLYKKINPGYKELMVKPKYDDDWGDAVKKALIQVGQNTIDPNHIDYRDPVTFAKKGGRIHIKKKNRGKFTAAAKRAGMGVQEFARHVLANKDRYSSTLVKRANFARNSKKFKHENGGILKQNIMIPDILKFFNGGGIPMFQNSGVVPGSDINDTEGNYSGGELTASVITPRQSKINRRREIRRAFKSIKNLIKSDNLDSQDVLNAYYGLNESQRKRALESAMKFSPEARPDKVLSMMKQGVLKRPRKAFQTLRYIITGKGEPKFFSYGYNRGYNGLWTVNDEEISNGLVDALVYGSPVNSKIGTQANKEDFGPILNYINKYYGNKDIQYIQTNPGVTINQNGITPTSYSGSHGSFKTSTPNAMINNQGFTLEKGTRNDSTFVRGLDVYDFQPNGYNKKWNKDGMHSVVEQVDEDTVPVAIKTPWVPEEDINTILAHPAGYQPYTP